MECGLYSIKENHSFFVSSRKKCQISVTVETKKQNAKVLSGYCLLIEFVLSIIFIKIRSI